MTDIKVGSRVKAKKMERPKSAVKLLGTEGEDRGDWAWFIGSEGMPHRFGAYDEVILYLNDRTVRVRVTRRRKKVEVQVDGEDWSRAALKEVL